MSTPRVFTVHLCEECPWYRDHPDYPEWCRHPNSVVAPGHEPPPGCPLRKQPALVSVEPGPRPGPVDEPNPER